MEHDITMDGGAVSPRRRANPVKAHSPIMFGYGDRYLDAGR